MVRWILGFCLVIGGCTLADSNKPSTLRPTDVALDPAASTPLVDAPTRAATSTGCVSRLDCVLPSAPANLPDLARFAATKSPDVLAAQAKVAQAQFSVDAARHAFYPTPYASANSAQDGESRLTIGLDQPISTGGRLRAELTIAQARKNASDIQLAVAQHQSAENLIQAYGSWMAATLRSQAWERGLKTQDRIVAIIARRVEAGVSSASDLVLAKSRRDSVYSESLTAQSDRAAALAKLSQTTGISLDEAKLAQNLAPEKPIRSSLQDTLAKANHSSPYLQLADAEIAAAQAGKASARSAFFPDVVLSMEHDKFADGRTDNRVSLGLKTKFGAGLASGSQVGIANAAVMVAERQKQSTERGIVEQVESTYALMTTSKQRLDALSTIANASKEVAASTQRQFETGVKTWQELMSTAREVASNEANLAEVQATYVGASWKLSLLIEGVDSL
ncbi:MAG: TolC family protein [Aliishimia sp.]